MEKKEMTLAKEFWINEIRYLQSPNGTMTKLCKFGNWTDHAAEACCSQPALESSMFCKFHDDGENFQFHPQQFISWRTGQYHMGQPEIGDFKYFNREVYKFDGKKWRKCCKMCDNQARGAYCKTHDPSNKCMRPSSGHSKIACDFIDVLSQQLNLEIMHKHIDKQGNSDDKEFKIPNTNFSVDGYDPTTKTVYEFLGDYYHGNRDLYNPDDLNKNLKQTYGELHRKTFERLQKIKAQDFRVFYIWEAEFKKFQQSGGKANLMAWLQSV